MIHGFEESNKVGLVGEDTVVAHLQSVHGCEVAKVTMVDQWRGQDYVVTDSCRELSWRAEIKTDKWAHKTGRAVVELVSNNVSGRKGWAYTTTADMILYYIITSEVLYWIEPSALRERLPEWIRRVASAERNFRTYSAPNKNYCTTGILVPLTAFENIAVNVESL